MPAGDRQMTQGRIHPFAFAKNGLNHFRFSDPNVDPFQHRFIESWIRISDAIVIAVELEACFLWPQGQCVPIVFLMEGAGHVCITPAISCAKPNEYSARPVT